MPDQETLIFLLGTTFFFVLLCLLFLGAQLQILLLLYSPLPPPEPMPEDLHNDDTVKVRVLP